jgi:hypothetical protein
MGADMAMQDVDLWQTSAYALNRQAHLGWCYL